jgi:hypothetical protein
MKEINRIYKNIINYIDLKIFEYFHNNSYHDNNKIK